MGGAIIALKIKEKANSPPTERNDRHPNGSLFFKSFTVFIGLCLTSVSRLHTVPTCFKKSGQFRWAGSSAGRARVF